MKLPKFLKFSTHAQGQKPKGKNITLQLADKQEPFGNLSIESIKAILEEEDFAQMQSLFFYMLRDLKIASVVQARKLPLLGLEYTIESDNQAFVEWVTAKIKMDTLINQLSSAIYCGVSLTDVSYQADYNLLKPDFRLISPRFLYVHKDKVLKQTIEHLYIKQGDKKIFINKLDPDKFVFHKHAVDVGEITDFSLASKLVWYFSLKHIAIAHNLQYFDAIATPPLVGKTEGDADDLVNALYDLKSATVGVFGKDDIVEYLKVEGKADFLAFIEYLDNQITTLVLGNTLATGQGKTGSYAQSRTHENRQKEVLHFDAQLIAETLSDFLSRLERLNFAKAAGVKFSFKLKEKKDLKALSEVVKNLSDSGFELDDRDIEEQFGLKIRGKKVNPQAMQKNTLHPASFGYGAPLSLFRHATAKNLPGHEDFLSTQNTETKGIEKALLNSVTTVLEQANSYDEAYQSLLGLYQDMPLNQLEQALFKAIANAQILADAEIEDEQA